MAVVVRLEDLVERLHEARDCLLTCLFSARMGMLLTPRHATDLEVCLSDINSCLSKVLAEQLESVAWPKNIPEV